VWLVNLCFTGDRAKPHSQKEWETALIGIKKELGFEDRLIPSTVDVFLPARDRSELMAKEGPGVTEGAQPMVALVNSKNSRAAKLGRRVSSQVPPGCLDRAALLRAIVRDRNLVDWEDPAIYDVRYPEFLLFFRRAPKLSRHHLIIGANFVYGWMPTMLDFRSERFEPCVNYLERARTQHDLGAAEVRDLAGLVNNSIVGASKLLHVVAPEHYAIWDSRVAEYLGATPTYEVAGAEQYIAYNDCCRSLASSPEATILAADLSAHVGCSLSPLRGLELVMFYASRDGRSYRM
jgi:hypothetical protein